MIRLIRFFSQKSLDEIVKICNLKENDSVFFSCDLKQQVEKITVGMIWEAKSDTQYNSTSDFHCHGNGCCFVLLEA